VGLFGETKSQKAAAAAGDYDDDVPFRASGNVSDDSTKHSLLL
jgi:hypothetical protein